MLNYPSYPYIYEQRCHLEEMHQFIDPNINTDKLIVEFGICSGGTASYIVKNMICDHFIGFDSFEGLPQEAVWVPKNPTWFPGSFSCQERLQTSTPQEAHRLIFQKLQKDSINTRITLHCGWFKDVFPTTIIDRKPYFIHIDTDIYSSTVEVLEYLHNNNVLTSGCVIRYDDWHSDRPELHEWEYGQSLAHKEYIVKYEDIFERLHMNVFRIK